MSALHHALRATLQSVAHAPLSARLAALAEVRALRTNARARFLAEVGGRDTAEAARAARRETT